MIPSDDDIDVYAARVELLRARVQRALGYGGLTTDKVSLVLDKEDCAIILACIHTAMGTHDADDPMPSRTDVIC